MKKYKDFILENRQDQIDEWFDAIYKNNIEKVKSFIDSGLGVNIQNRNRDRFTGLNYASYHGHKEIVELFLKQPNININIGDNDGGTPLINIIATVYATPNDKLNIIELLLAQPGIDINHKNNNGDTALMYASYNGQVDIVKLLLKQPNIDVYNKNIDGMNFIDDAAENVIKFLKINYPYLLTGSDLNLL